MLVAESQTERFIGLAIEVHRNTGRGLLESVYEQCLCFEFVQADIPYERQVGIPEARRSPLLRLLRKPPWSTVALARPPY